MTTAQLLRVSGDLRAQTRRGLPLSALERLREQLELPANELHRAAKLTRRTLTRRRAQRRLSSEESDRVVRLAAIAQLAIDALGDRKRAGRWLRSPIVALGGARPIDLVDTEAGSELVRGALAALIYGGVA